MIKINLKDLMKKNKISINKLSNETGLSRPTLTSLLNNESKGVQFDTLETLLDYFDVSLTDLLTVTDREITFYYYEKVSMENLLWVEENSNSNNRNNNDLVEIKPSENFLFDCQIIDTKKNIEPFSLVVSPQLNENKIIVVNLAIFRSNKNRAEDTSDINTFLSKLNDDAIIKFTDCIISEWLKFYLKLKPLELFLKSMLFVDIVIYGYKTRIPVVVDVSFNKDNVTLSYETYKRNSKIKKGDDIYSSKINFIHGKP
ncbi:helix-turn-helix domain-containing protein [Streptococcus pluranimalium]|uniref:helix-turn-helix domain-containing protein n=1 Tax=Streptococcus pluranimalium TaxID=82348 RepID=UPI0039FD5EE6